MGRAKIHLHQLASIRGRPARPLGTTQSVIIANAVESAPLSASDTLVATVTDMTLIAMSAIVPATSDTPIQVGHLQPKTSPSDSCLLVIIFR